ncbi:hypothetical protein PPACK8108_LOCUS18508 [Phakopsora pachyrhizi]|uniref:Zinc finger PHD-type domain-containing protein n=1 Tax=Phakopsora pachyrhizi TaxID=170000 RepID=A0AAV0BDH6_PHAPC|nr:hypothetical protein PPACK8108_LOCUS18508 [Phakopsora pachyrhizi]
MTVETARVCIAVFPAYHPQISTCGFWLRLGDDCQLAINPKQLPGPRGSLAGVPSRRGDLGPKGRSNKGSLSAATSSELSEPVPSDDSTAILVRKSRRLSSNHKVEKILSQVDTDKEEDGEAAYFCRVQGSKRQIKLKESDLKRVPNLLRSFKSKNSESLASGEDDKSNFSRSKSLAQPTSASEVMSSDSDSPNLRRRSKRQKKHYQRSILSSTSDQAQLNPKNVCRSTRSSQSRPKYNFRTLISSEEEEEEDELGESGSDCSKQKKNRKNQRYVMSEESDESEYKSGRSRSQNQSKAVARKGFSPEGRKPRSEYHPDCTKRGIEFQPGLLSTWIKADKNQKSKVRTGNLLDRFLSLEEVYAQGCWLECSDCSSSYHFGCLPADMKKDIAAQHKAERLLIMEQMEKSSENNPVNSVVNKALSFVRNFNRIYSIISNDRRLTEEDEEGADDDENHKSNESRLNRAQVDRNNVGIGKPRLELLKSYKNFSSQPGHPSNSEPPLIEALGVIMETNLVIVLSGGDITFHNLNSLDLQLSCEKWTKLQASSMCLETAVLWQNLQGVILDPAMFGTTTNHSSGHDSKKMLLTSPWESQFLSHSLIFF